MQIESSSPQEILCLGNCSFVVFSPLSFWGERVRSLGMVIVVTVQNILSNIYFIKNIS